jgi:hypothetical protein
MNKQQASGRMGCRSIAVSDTNKYQFPSSLIQPHISFHPFVPIISNRNYKLLLKFWSWIKNYISIEYYCLDMSISVVNIVVVNTPIQWYDIISSPLSPRCFISSVTFWENTIPWASQATRTEFETQSRLYGLIFGIILPFLFFFYLLK